MSTCYVNRQTFCSLIMTPPPLTESLVVQNFATDINQLIFYSFPHSASIVERVHCTAHHETDELVNEAIPPLHGHLSSQLCHSSLSILLMLNDQKKGKEVAWFPWRSSAQRGPRSEEELIPSSPSGDYSDKLVSSPRRDWSLACFAHSVPGRM